MAGKNDNARLQVRIEPWEDDVLKSVVSSFRTFAEYEDLKATLYKRLVEIKVNKKEGVRDERAFLATSLYNAAKDFIRRWEVRERGRESLESTSEEEGPSLSLDEVLAGPDEKADLKLDIERIRKELSPEFQELWTLLAEEEGNIAAVARKLGRSPKTVQYWFKKLKDFLKKRGFF